MTFCAKKPRLKQKRPDAASYCGIIITLCLKLVDDGRGVFGYHELLVGGYYYHVHL